MVFNAITFSVLSVWGRTISIDARLYIVKNISAWPLVWQLIVQMEAVTMAADWTEMKENTKQQFVEKSRKRNKNILVRRNYPGCPVPPVCPAGSGLARSRTPS